MAKNSITDYDNTAANNADVQSVDISEGCSPSGINNAIREVMADLADVNDGTVALTSPQAGSLTVTGDLTVDTSTLKVDSTNNRVGIGTTSPDRILSISGGASADSGMIRSEYNDTGYYREFGRNNSSGFFEIRRAQGGSATTDMSIDLNGHILFTSNAAYDSTPYSGYCSAIQNDTSGTVHFDSYSSGGSTALSFGTNESAGAVEERMRINSNGLVTFNGNKGGSSDAQVNIVNDEAGGLYRCLNLYTGVTGNRIMQSFFNGNGQVGTITTNASSTAYNTSSDYRLKENVTDITGATERLKQLNPVRFNFIADADTTVDGFLAHEVQDVVPEAITGTKDAMRDEQYEVTPAVLDDDGNEITPAVMGTRSVPDYQGIDQSKLVPLLVATIQELEARITALEAN